MIINRRLPCCDAAFLDSPVHFAQYGRSLVVQLGADSSINRGSICGGTHNVYRVHVALHAQVNSAFAFEHCARHRASLLISHQLTVLHTTDAEPF